MKKILFWILEIFFIFCFVSTCFFSCNVKPPEDFERIESVKLCSINTDDLWALKVHERFM